jgi:hypothetical protein
MTEDNARKVANALITAAAVSAAVVIARTPSLRRMAVGLALSAVTAGIPAWFSRELQSAWTQSRQRAL